MAERRHDRRRVGVVVALIGEQGEIVSINFDPSKRHEPAGRHYGIVLSTWDANIRASLTYVVPVTSTDNGHPFHVPIASGNPISGFAQCEGLRAIDLGAREAEGAASSAGMLDDATLGDILDIVQVILGQR